MSYNKNYCATNLAKIGMRFAYGLAFAYAALLSLVTAQAIENILLPVVKDFRIAQYEHYKDRLIISGTFDKVRDCRFVEVVAYSGDKLVALRYLDNVHSDSGTSRSTGKQAYGPWEINPDSATLRIAARHQCHLLWDSTTTLAHDVKL